MSTSLKDNYRIGTRKSPLALRQVDEVIRALSVFYPGLEYEIVGIDTLGDKDKLTPISDIEGSDFFTREVEDALCAGEVDFAVHSAKDMPDEIRRGLVIAALTKPLEPCDALVSRDGKTLDTLPRGARIGASSERRKAQLKKYRNDFQIVDIRGTINERLAKLDAHEVDGVIVAACALARLGLNDRITQRVPLDIFTPQPLQGALAIEAREDRGELIEMLRVLDERKILNTKS